MIDSALEVPSKTDPEMFFRRRVRSGLKLDLGPFGCVRPGDAGVVVKVEAGAPDGRILHVVFPDSLRPKSAARVPFFLRTNQVCLD